MKLYRNWIINEVARAGEHTNERTYVRTYVLTYIRTGQTLNPLHNFVVRGDNKKNKPDKTCLQFHDTISRTKYELSTLKYCCEICYIKFHYLKHGRKENHTNTEKNKAGECWLYPAIQNIFSSLYNKYDYYSFHGCKQSLTTNVIFLTTE